MWLIYMYILWGLNSRKTFLLTVMVSQVSHRSLATFMREIWEKHHKTSLNAHEIVCTQQISNLVVCLPSVTSLCSFWDCRFSLMIKCIRCWCKTSTKVIINRTVVVVSVTSILLMTILFIFILRMMMRIPVVMYIIILIMIIAGMHRQVLLKWHCQHLMMREVRVSQSQQNK